MRRVPDAISGEHNRQQNRTPAERCAVQSQTPDSSGYPNGPRKEERYGQRQPESKRELKRPGHRARQSAVHTPLQEQGRDGARQQKEQRGRQASPARPAMDFEQARGREVDEVLKAEQERERNCQEDQKTPSHRRAMLAA